MTTDEVEKKLKSIKKLDKAIQSLDLKISNLEKGAVYSQAQFEQRVKSSKVNTTEERLINALRLKDQMMEQLQDLIVERYEALRFIDNLRNPNEWVVITMVYVNHYTIDRVCRELHKSKKVVYRLKKQALEYLSEVLKPINTEETTKQAYRFLKSYLSLVKLSLDNQDGAFEAKAVEIVGMIEAYRDNLDDVRREIFANLFTRRSIERMKLWQLYETLDIDKAQYERLKAEILLDFAKSYRGGVLVVYEQKARTT